MKTISIKGKEYAPVNERILEFHSKYPNGRITTEIISHDEGIVLMKATVYPDVDKLDRYFTGMASEYQEDKRSMVNATSYIENCETSAVGRALGMLGIGIETSLASSNEVQIAQKKAELNEGIKCEKCGKDMSYAEKMYSQKMFKLEYCRDCQKELRTKDTPF